MKRWVCLSQSLHDGKDKSIAIATSGDNKLKNHFANTCVCKCSRVSLVVCVVWLAPPAQMMTIVWC